MRFMGHPPSDVSRKRHRPNETASLSEGRKARLGVSAEPMSTGSIVILRIYSDTLFPPIAPRSFPPRQTDARGRSHVDHASSMQGDARLRLTRWHSAWPGSGVSPAHLVGLHRARPPSSRNRAGRVDGSASGRFSNGPRRETSTCSSSATRSPRAGVAPRKRGIDFTALARRPTSASAATGPSTSSGGSRTASSRASSPRWSCS